MVEEKEFMQKVPYGGFWDNWNNPKNLYSAHIRNEMIDYKKAMNTAVSLFLEKISDYGEEDITQDEIEDSILCGAFNDVFLCIASADATLQEVEKRFGHVKKVDVLSHLMIEISRKAGSNAVEAYADELLTKMEKRSKIKTTDYDRL